MKIIGKLLFPIPYLFTEIYPDESNNRPIKPVKSIKPS